MKNMEAKRKQFQNESSSTPTIDGTLAQRAEVTNEVATYDPHCSLLLMEKNGCNFPIYLFQLLKFAREKVFRVFRCHSGGPGLLGGDVQWFSTHWMITTSILWIYPRYDIFQLWTQSDGTFSTATNIDNHLQREMMRKLSRAACKQDPFMHLHAGA